MTQQWARTLVTVGLLLATITGVVAQENQTVLVRGGTFRMGTPESKLSELKRRYTLSFPGVFADEVPDHAVTVSDFRMDRHEVTNARFSEFVDGHPEWSRAQIPPQLHNGHYLEHWRDGQLPATKANHPAGRAGLGFTGDGGARKARPARARSRAARAIVRPSPTRMTVLAADSDPSTRRLRHTDRRPAIGARAERRS